VTVHQLFTEEPAFSLREKLKTSAAAPFRAIHQVPALSVPTNCLPHLYPTSGKEMRYLFSFSLINILTYKTGQCKDITYKTGQCKDNKSSF
jgi:hypothetical protein